MHSSAAGITAMTIMATIASSVSIHPVYIALAALAGGISVGHVNDSGFWGVRAAADSGRQRAVSGYVNLKTIFKLT